MWVCSLDCEYPLEKEMATHSSILAWRIPWTEEPGRLQSIRGKESDMTEVTEHACTPKKKKPMKLYLLLVLCVFNVSDRFGSLYICL